VRHIMSELKKIHGNFMRHRMLRFILLIVMAANITLAAIAAFMYPPFFTIPHAGYYFLELGIMHLVYIIMVIAITRHTISPVVFHSADITISYWL
jgi:hypothetical protein